MKLLCIFKEKAGLQKEEKPHAGPWVNNTINIFLRYWQKKLMIIGNRMKRSVVLCP